MVGGPVRGVLLGTTPVAVSAIDQEFQDYGELPIVMSPEGSALAWVGEDRSLQIYGRAADGTWTAPTIIWRYKYLPYVGSMRFSNSGSRLSWAVEDTKGVLTAVRSSGGRSSADYVSTDGAFSPAMAPDGELVAFASYTDDAVYAKHSAGGRSTRVKRVGKALEESLITAGRNTLAWSITNRTSPGGPLWATKLSRVAFNPVLNPAGTTLLYTDLKRDAELATRH